MTICDLKNDNYYKLIAAEIPYSIDMKPKLKVYKGSQLISEQGLPGIPSAIEFIYIDECEPKTPIIAVAVGPSILFYRNMKPYYKFTVPSLAVEALEQDIWKKLPHELPANIANLINDLKSIELLKLSPQSQKLIALTNTEKRDNFIKENAESKPERLSVIVAMSTIYKNVEEEKSAMCLIIATETGEVLVLESQSFNILHESRVCTFKSTPDLLSASGCFNSDYKIVISTREGSLCLLRKNWLEGREIVRLEHPATGMALLPIDQTIVVLSNSLMCFSKKGKLLWSSNLPQDAICLTPVPLPHLGISLVCVGLKGGLVQIYCQKHLVDQFYAPDTVLSIYFGPLGLEEHVLVLVTISGTLLIKILKRMAEFPLNIEDNEQNNNSNLLGTVNLSIPKKTKIFIEQTIREREHAATIHNMFQSELWRMRLTAAKTTLEILKSADSSFSGDIGQAALKLLAEVAGLGPDFILYVTLENISATKIATNLYIIIHADSSLYKIERRFVELSPIVPGFSLKMDFDVSSQLTPEGLPVEMSFDTSIIRVLIMKEGLSKPLIASTVVMPESEPQMLDTY
ncbi:unnamed protein product [Diamesa hyperborea]